MYDSGLMQAYESCQNLTQVVYGLVQRQSSGGIFDFVGFSYDETQAVAVVLHDQEGSPLGLVKIPYGYNIGMSQRGHGHGFSDEAFSDLLHAH